MLFRSHIPFPPAVFYPPPRAAALCSRILAPPGIAAAHPAHDMIQEDDVLFEVNTAKVSAEIPSPVAGKVVEILYKEGDTVAVGTVVAIIDLDGEEASGTEPASEGTANEGADAGQVAADVSGTSQSSTDTAKNQSVNTASTPVDTSKPVAVEEGADRFYCI